MLLIVIESLIKSMSGGNRNEPLSHPRMYYLTTRSKLPLRMKQIDEKTRGITDIENSLKMHGEMATARKDDRSPPVAVVVMVLTRKKDKLY